MEISLSRRQSDLSAQAYITDANGNDRAISNVNQRNSKCKNSEMLHFKGKCNIIAENKMAHDLFDSRIKELPLKFKICNVSLSKEMNHFMDTCRSINSKFLSKYVNK